VGRRKKGQHGPYAWQMKVMKQSGLRENGRMARGDCRLHAILFVLYGGPVMKYTGPQESPPPPPRPTPHSPRCGAPGS
jgi:hypothetical protein